MQTDVQPIINALSRSSDITVTVLGDYCLDKYLYINPKRDEASLETGLTAYQVHRKAIFPGASGTVTNNLRALGVNVICVGTVGNDGEGFELTRALERISADTSLLVRTDDLCTNTYTKPMRKDADGIYREMSRLDFRNPYPTPSSVEEKIIQNTYAALEKSQAVLILDQFTERNFSVVTDTVRDAAAEMAHKNPEKIFYADSRGFIHLFHNMIVKCNQMEAVKAVMPEYQGDINNETLYVCGKKLFKRNGRPVVLSMGEQGLLIIEDDAVEPVHTPAFRIMGEIDIVGAGDATNAGFVLGLSLGLGTREAGILGCCVSSITVEQIGVTGTATVPQVTKRLLEYAAQVS